VAEGMSYEQMLAAQRDGRVSGGVTPVDETDRMRVVAYTDGSSRGNPGPGGYGAVLLYTDPNGVTHTKELSQGYRRTTNNRMELMGVIAALEALRRPCQVELHSDSQYVVNAFNKHWVEGWQKRGWKTASKQPVKNPDLWRRLLQAKRAHEVTFVWVKGHAGHQYNERCDELATTSADGLAGPLLDDSGFEG
jgi:ribonuclease HI